MLNKNFKIDHLKGNLMFNKEKYKINQLRFSEYGFIFSFTLQSILREKFVRVTHKICVMCCLRAA